jgi:hypothetical protein
MFCMHCIFPLFVLHVLSHPSLFDYPNNVRLEFSSNVLGGRRIPLNAMRSKARVVLVRSNTGIVGSNLSRGMDICPYFSVLCCPV